MSVAQRYCEPLHGKNSTYCNSRHLFDRAVEKGGTFSNTCWVNLVKAIAQETTAWLSFSYKLGQDNPPMPAGQVMVHNASKGASSIFSQLGPIVRRPATIHAKRITYLIMLSITSHHIRRRDFGILGSSKNAESKCFTFRALRYQDNQGVGNAMKEQLHLYLLYSSSKLIVVGRPWSFQYSISSNRGTEGHVSGVKCVVLGWSNAHLIFSCLFSSIFCPMASSRASTSSPSRRVSSSTIYSSISNLRHTTSTRARTI